MGRLRVSCVAALAGVLAAGCELPSGSLPARVAPLDRVEPSPGSTVTQAILVTAADGAPLATGVQLVLDAEARRLGVRLGGTLTIRGTDSLSATSDARGVATTTVTFGWRSGRAVLHLRVPETATSDSIVFTLSNGTVAHIVASPVTPAYVGDTVAYVFATYDDAYYGVFGDPVVTVADTAVATVRNDTVFAKTTGFTWIRATQGGLVDSVPLAVVPAGRLGALVSGYIWTRFDLNGTGRTNVFDVTSAFSGPRSSPSGDTLAYTDGAHIRLRRPGPVTAALVPAALGFAYDVQAAWSGDGQWLYFSAGYADDRAEIWRISPDGSGAARAGPVAGAGTHDRAPSVSRDGTLLAFTTDRTLDAGLATVRIIALGTGATVWPGPAGSAPRFSPTGDRLAFLSAGRLQIVNADGTSLRSLAPTLTGCSGQLAWSPDGRWIVVASAIPGDAWPYLHLVDASAGTVIRLPYAWAWTLPDWR